MNREVHVRICESVGVRLPRATRLFVRINGELYYLWRAVDHEGEVLEVFVTRKRDRRAALRFLRKAMKRCGRPEVVVTDRLHISPSGDGNAPWRSSGAPNHFRNSSPFMQQSTTTSTKNATSTIGKTSNTNALPPWRSGANLRPEIADYGDFEPANLLSDSARNGLSRAMLRCGTQSDTFDTKSTPTPT